MSLLDELAADIAGASDHLPLSGLRLAARDIARATERLRGAVALIATAQPTRPPYAPLFRLGHATTHLETTLGLLLRAQDEMSGYLATIGAAGTLRDDRHTDAIAAPGEPRSAVERAAPAAHELWWVRRVASLTAETGPGSADPAGTVDELLGRVAAHARLGNRPALYAELRAVSPAIGFGLSGAVSALLHRLPTRVDAADPPGRADLATRRAPADLAARADLAAMLPGLPAAVTEALLARLCPASPFASGHLDPVDLAVGAAVMVGRLLTADGRGADRRPAHA